MIVAESASSAVGCVQIAQVAKGAALPRSFVGRAGRAGFGHRRQLVAAAEICALEQFGASELEITFLARSELIEWYRRLDYVLNGKERHFSVSDLRFGISKTHRLAFCCSENSLPIAPRKPRITDLHQPDHQVNQNLIHNLRI